MTREREKLLDLFLEGFSQAMQTPLYRFEHQLRQRLAIRYPRMKGGGQVALEHQIQQHLDGFAVELARRFLSRLPEEETATLIREKLDAIVPEPAPQPEVVA